MYRILVIDDEEEIREAVQRRLRRERFEVDLAQGQADGLERIVAANPPYDLILTDMVMEDPQSGVRVLEAALGRDIFSEVIVLTAYGNVGNAVECMRRGAFDYVDDVRLHDFRRSALPRKMYRNYREVDIGQLSDAETAVAYDAEYHERRHKHPREYGIFYRKVRKSHLALPFRSGRQQRAAANIAS